MPPGVKICLRERMFGLEWCPGGPLEAPTCTTESIWPITGHSIPCLPVRLVFRLQLDQLVERRLPWHRRPNGPFRTFDTRSPECRLFVEDRTSIRNAGTSLLAKSRLKGMCQYPYAVCSSAPKSLGRGRIKAGISADFNSTHRRHRKGAIPHTKY